MSEEPQGIQLTSLAKSSHLTVSMQTEGIIVPVGSSPTIQFTVNQFELGAIQEKGTYGNEIGLGSACFGMAVSFFLALVASPPTSVGPLSLFYACVGIGSIGTVFFGLLGYSKYKAFRKYIDMLNSRVPPEMRQFLP